MTAVAAGAGPASPMAISAAVTAVHDKMRLSTKRTPRRKKNAEPAGRHRAAGCFSTRVALSRSWEVFCAWQFTSDRPARTLRQS